jgi:hypothetical protein
MKIETSCGQVMPVFIFERKRQIEIETGLTLAGLLVVDLPKGKKLKHRDLRMIGEILNMLSAERVSGRMPDDAVIYGWSGGVRPSNADEILRNDELMCAWVKTKITIEFGGSQDDGFLFGPDLRHLINGLTNGMIDGLATCSHLSRSNPLEA